MSHATRATTTTCSTCSIGLTVDSVTVTAVTPSNGKRGALHIPAHAATGDVYVDATYGEDLLMWDCPACGAADSLDVTQDGAR